jgi:phospholipid/cholesterol/gamma-HCH transport system substrate-binding protein
MENRAHAIAVGLFTLLLGAGVVLLVMWFSGDTEKRETYRLESQYAVTGLNVQAPVRFRGVEVGRVESIAFSGEKARSIAIEVSVKADTPITRGTYAQLGSQGVTGLAYVILDDDGDKAQTLSPDESQKSPIPVRRSFIDEVSGSGKDLVAGANEVAHRLSALLNEKNQAQLMKTLESLDAATRGIASLAGKLEPVMRDVPAMTRDARQALGRADTLLANMNKLTVELTQRVDTLERVSRSAEQVGGAAESFSGAAVSETLPRINALLEELARNSRSLDRLLTQVNEQPSSLVFGRPTVTPGPGEAGFNPRGGAVQ